MTHNSITTRRRLIKGGLAVAASIATPAVLRAQGRRDLSILTWAGHADPDVIGAFEETHKGVCDVAIYTLSRERWAEREG